MIKLSKEYVSYSINLYGIREQNTPIQSDVYLVLPCNNWSCRILIDQVQAVLDNPGHKRIECLNYEDRDDEGYLDRAFYALPEIGKLLDDQVESKRDDMEKSIEQRVQGKHKVISDKLDQELVEGEIMRLIVYYRLQKISFQKIADILSTKHNHLLTWQAVQNRLRRFTNSLAIK